MCDLPVPSPLALTNQLKQAVKNSLNRGYHNSKTNFAGILASGVSKILLKGQTYSCNTNLKRVFLEEVWGYKDNVIYLDASCLVFKFDASIYKIIDYHNRKDTNEAIEHSGDIITREKYSGKHTITISLEKLPSDVKALFFTISSWTTLLTDILDPYVMFIDPDTQQSLCGYEYSGKDTGNKTSVIMAKMYRETPTGKWTVQAIGHLWYGRADSYDPITKLILQEYL